jgi:cell division protein FtsW
VKVIFKHIKGDRTIWALVAILALFSFMPVYSASANLVSIVGGSTLGYLIKHVVLLIMGFAIIYAVHKIPYRYFSGDNHRPRHARQRTRPPTDTTV